MKTLTPKHHVAIAILKHNAELFPEQADSNYDQIEKVKTLDLDCSSAYYQCLTDNAGTCVTCDCSTGAAIPCAPPA